ncbi:MAG: hypothetical protein BWY29_00804 [Microgenomates group bacterium ADurb.Bin238]|nr:MAG: hypothetical protein BWY29_00804 [Microgenomates group bacterium ADurb.Bin238]
MKVSCWKDEELGWFFLMIGEKGLELLRMFVLSDALGLIK